jgi:proteasome lid subunit RPN8/RPN11
MRSAPQSPTIETVTSSFDDIASTITIAAIGPHTRGRLSRPSRDRPSRRRRRRDAPQRTPAPVATVPAVLELPQEIVDDIVALAVEEYPYEACGLLAGPAGDDTVTHFYRCANAARSARVYTIEPRDHLRAERDADDRGWEIIGVVHSHTHTEARPSPTDVAQAPDPGWHYAIVSLRDQTAPSLRSYRIVDGEATEEDVVVA